MSIFLARHAETEQNAARVIQVPATPLSAEGRLQAERLAERIASVGIARILASDLIRAVETATIVGARIGAQVELEPTLRERDFGDLRGTAYTSLTVDPFAPDYIPPKGESWADFHFRVALAWVRITHVAAETSGNLLVITHGMVCRVLAERHLDLLPDQSAPRQWENTAVTEVDAVPPWKVRRMNCVAHLASERVGRGSN